MTETVVVIDQDRTRAMELAMRLAATRYSVTVAETAPGALARARRYAAERPTAIVYALTGIETVVDIRTLMELAPQTRFVMLVPEFPPSAALARVVNAGGGVLLRAGESPVVVASTVVAILAAIGAA